ncbi:exported hypothetical protein [Vibrio crassostreae]|nr:hypothetical protein EDB53_0763 [Vibrio crassostreae]ROR70343.1 hypothetical protein EDB59_0996 [Vibrio crassostreae]ROR75495.1 hypothetical protein EDB54_1006 [Vibrio crassostreae]ROR86606.1 hypothetical protein EDB55_1298 [Vibrio crassostreae]TCV32946.1 hypothetical protein EDB70_101932 [Vibrio crassostreae]
MKRLILNITLLVFMAIGSMNAIAHDSMLKYGIAISHDGEQIAYGKSGSGDTALIFIHGWSLDSRPRQLIVQPPQNECNIFFIKVKYLCHGSILI